MTVYLPVSCPDCHSVEVIKQGKSGQEKQRYLCQNSDCLRKTFVLNVATVQFSFFGTVMPS